jgi:hypothetical protein
MELGVGIGIITAICAANVIVSPLIILRSRKKIVETIKPTGLGLGG